MPRSLMSARTLQTGTDWAGEGSLFLYGIILMAGIGTGILFVASLFAYRQRQSTRYLAITAAVGALFVRSVVGFGTATGRVPMIVHHLIEHTFDFMIAALVLYAAYLSTPTQLEPNTGDVPEEQVSEKKPGGGRSRE